MDNLKNFIEQNRSSFETEEISKNNRIRFINRTKRPHNYLFNSFLSVAAMGIIIFGATFLIRNINTVSPVEMEISLYEADFAEVSNDIMELCKSNGTDTTDIKFIIDQVYSDAIPIYNQLPEGLSAGEKAFILKRYFKQKLGAMKQIYAQIEEVD